MKRQVACFWHLAEFLATPGAATIWDATSTVAGSTTGKAARLNFCRLAFRPITSHLLHDAGGWNRRPVASTLQPTLKGATGLAFCGNSISVFLPRWQAYQSELAGNDGTGSHNGNPASPGALASLRYVPKNSTTSLCPTACASVSFLQFRGVHHQRQHRDQQDKLRSKVEHQSLQFLSNNAVDRNSGKSSPAADAVYNLPNAVSAARLLSGPVIGYWLLQGHTEAAAVALAISGASDWLDGYLARRMGASSVFGSYLDPLADKVLIGCVAGALLANGAMPAWLAVVVVGRDVLLVSGAFTFRLRGFGWRWPGREAFFRTKDAISTAAEAGVPASASASTDAGGGDCSTRGRESVGFMRPLLISKANTVLQLMLLGAYLTRGTYGWPEGDPVLALELATAATTILSLTAYGSMALQGKLFK
ncbi:hypothetical protein VOLCADRAFT_103401 [Volvox carteri f. nagariensis]|uniref:Uncharacterized protein n=1 Tax=Volvox carteri f. nagariensis TaxID=3068 RepID=D8TLL7_VOLCA|nr:uncharacterized protein VOLCADRAFT_103401 [Volvox carteri f. nagariensis]EFJ51896.1 hypothetical protein VOLCADRAFT_103401 [Volvox carteri f. nagariensis]|eukprot:XP_002947306.1 hypothetical protein VOLCADRAFT_103401 [Volvox carteri f. nagariensis]